MSSAIRLSKRLGAAASFVRKGSFIADVGTDHAYLPIALCEAGLIRGAVASYTHLILMKETEGVTHSPLVQTPETAYLVTAATQMPIPGSYPICVLAEKADSAVVWLSMPVDSMANQLSGGGNFTLVKQSFDHFTEHSGSALKGMTDTQIPPAYIATTNGATTFWLLAFVIVIPVAVLAVGAVRYYMRKKQG